MKITIVCVGKIREKYLREGIADFLKRLQPYAQVEIRETPDEKMPENPSAAEKEQALQKEGERLLHLVPRGSYLFVLDVFGREFSSEAFAADLAELALHGRSALTFLIGGTFGLSKEVRAAADARISFSKFTFTHWMVRLLLVEQIYRAFKINRGEKYHW